MTRSLERYVYTLTGPSGTYVGQSADPNKRLRAHRALALRPPKPREPAVYAAMRVDGVAAYALSIVFGPVGPVFALQHERATVRRLRARGARVLNLLPSAAARDGGPLASMLIERRDARGLSRADVARSVGASAYQVGRWELGLAIPNIDRLPALADVLGVSVDDLLSSPRAIDIQHAAGG